MFEFLSIGFFVSLFKDFFFFSLLLNIGESNDELIEFLKKKKEEPKLL